MSPRDLVFQVTGLSSLMTFSLQTQSAKGTKLSAFSAQGSAVHTYYPLSQLFCPSTSEYSTWTLSQTSSGVLVP